MALRDEYGLAPRGGLLSSGRAPISRVEGAGLLGPLYDGVMQGAKSIAQEFDPPRMAQRYQNAMNYAPMSNTERLLSIMPAADIIGGGLLTGAKVPRNALASNAVRREGAETLPEVEEIVAYHGSPHNFDKFQMDKLGTGEGALAYGHGLYFAGDNKISDYYRKTLSEDTFLAGEDVFNPSSLQNINVKVKVRNDGLENGIEKAKQIIEKSKIDNSFSEAAGMAREDLKILEEIKLKGGLKENKGKAYKVDLGVSNDSLLDYNEELQHQSTKVQEAVKKLGMTFSPNIKGEQIYEQISAAYAKPPFDSGRSYTSNPSQAERASKILLESGIKGVKFRDSNFRDRAFNIKLYRKGKPYEYVTEPITASSRKNADKIAKEYQDKGWETKIEPYGTNNFVMFDDKTIKILAKYGIVGGAGLAAANEFSSPAQANEYPYYMPPQAPELDANPARLLRGLLPNEA